MQMDGEKVIERMSNRSMTVRELSEQTGIARSTISRVRAGGKCHRYTAETIAQALGAEAKDFQKTR